MSLSFQPEMNMKIPHLVGPRYKNFSNNVLLLLTQCKLLFHERSFFIYLPSFYQYGIWWRYKNWKRIVMSSLWKKYTLYYIFTYFNLGFLLFFQVALVGSDTFVNQVLRPYVELFSSKPPDWQGFIKFFIIPLGVNTVSKHIGTQVRSSLRSFK